MPRQYEHIRDSYVKAGKPLKTAKKLAAMTYNAHRKPGQAPVGPHSDDKKVLNKKASHAVKKHLTAAMKAKAKGKWPISAGSLPISPISGGLVL